VAGELIVAKLRTDVLALNAEVPTTALPFEVSRNETVPLGPSALPVPATVAVSE
jgi:hypothetical protein